MKERLKEKPDDKQIKAWMVHVWLKSFLDTKYVSFIAALWGKASTKPENYIFTMIVFTSFTFPQMFLLKNKQTGTDNMRNNEWNETSDSEQHWTLWKYEILESEGETKWESHCGG